MLLSRKLFALSALFLSLVLLNPHALLAIGEEAPIIALASNNIYFVSPADGAARLIVERDLEKDALLTEMYAGADLELSPMSPDNTKFAYTAPLYEVFDPAYEDKLGDIATLRPRELFIVDIATEEVTPITDQGAHFADVVKNDGLTNISNLTWSLDGQRLYFLASVLSLRNRVPQNTIEYYDLASGERRVLVKLRPRRYVGLYVIQRGVVALAESQRDFEFTLYDPEGGVFNSIVRPLYGTQDCTNGTLFAMNPVYNAGSYYYGYYPHDSEELVPALLDVASEDSVALDKWHMPALLSHSNPETSLRLVFEGFCEYQKDVRWALTDPTGEHIEMSQFKGVYHAFELALSPNGQSVAMINGDTIRIIEVNSDTTRMQDIGDVSIPILEDNATRELDFTATRLLWGAMDFTFARVIYRG